MFKWTEILIEERKYKIWANGIRLIDQFILLKRRKRAAKTIILNI